MRAGFRQCADQNERLHFLNSTANRLRESAPRMYCELVEQTLASETPHSRPVEYARVLYHFAMALAQTGESAGARNYGAKAQNAADECGDLRLRIESRELLADVLVCTGHALEGMAQLNAARSLHHGLPEDSDPEHGMRCGLIAAAAEMLTGRYVQALAELQRVVATGAARGDKFPAEGVYTRLATIYAFQERYDDAARLLETSLEQTRANKSICGIRSTLLTLAWLDCRRGTVDERSYAHIEEAQQMTGSICRSCGPLRADFVHARVLIVDGRAKEATALLRTAEKSIQAEIVPAPAAELHLLLALAAAETGDAGAGAAHADRALEIARRGHYRETEVEALAVRIEIGKRGEDEAAVEGLKIARDRIRRELLAQAENPQFVDDLRSIETELARQHLLRELARAEQLQDENVQVRSERNRTQQRLTSKTLQISNKNELLYQAQKLLRKHVDRVDAGVRSRFKDLLRTITIHLDEDDLWKEFDEQFALAHPEFMDELRRHFPNLTPTERKVCALMKLEMSSKEICRVLRIGRRSIETHRYNIRKKMGIGGKVGIGEAIATLGRDSG